MTLQSYVRVLVTKGRNMSNPIKVGDCVLCDGAVMLVQNAEGEQGCACKHCKQEYQVYHTIGIELTEFQKQILRDPPMPRGSRETIPADPKPKKSKS